MPINSTHHAYEKFADKWERTRDTFDGSDAVKEKGSKYLPQVQGQNKDEYNAYKMRALYFDGVERTVRGLVGAVMRIDPIVEAPNKLKELFGDITNTGVSLNNLISTMIQEQLLMGRQGLLIDYDNSFKRTYLLHYITEQITNWLDDKIILQEASKIPKDDIYDIKYETQYRELTLKDSQYIVNIWTKNTKDDEWVKGDDIVAENKNKTLDFIPFVSISTDGFNLEPSKSSVLSLADVSLSLYRTSADLEHGRHYTALPTPYVTGYEAQDGVKFNIGPSKIWLLPRVEAKVGLLEFTGQGLKALSIGMDEKIAMMAALGSQLLQGQKAGVEAADTVRLRQNAEASTLVGAVKMVEKAITQALVMMNDWSGWGGTDTISVKLNTDFVDSKMSPQEITAMMSAWQGGGISHDSLLYNFKRGERLQPNVDIQTEKDKISIENENLIK
jgi:hypothetical protein